MNWPKIALPAAGGECRAIAPLIVSASRATDIPAFYMAWLMRRLREGHCVWVNPFNRARQYISFSRCKFIVFWSKNPAPLIPRLQELRDRGLDLYVQFTLNDYEAEGLEPGLPSLQRRLETFARLSELLGRKRVLWRFDPLLLGADLPAATLLGRISRLAGTLQDLTDTLTFSFLDIAPYAKVRARMRKRFPAIREPDAEEIPRLAEGIARCNAALRAPLMLASCAEKADLSACGIRAASCVDMARIRVLCPEAAMPLPLKDRGQRAACGCAPAKDIGAYGTCGHLCAYCYAYSSAARGRPAPRGGASEAL
ncbi:MAG: DUF1848 domain-containing protein [Deltaproteobacteria bacterium]|jgi:hypothetical protein|nr:DUF1848 domain-containing protein [Deltaproteobacteria bacterium]